ncbi:ABC transporter ATP-binding protein [Streptomyces sp. B6B3]|uniref:ABC transporter ATP-binding protein n=1 Tax=Streptomyces sp. B6B3 TaxID=3153570 RepID=UPI00325CB2DD
MKRYLALWAELLRLSWRRVPGLTAVLLVLNALMATSTFAIALTLKAVVDEADAGRPAQAMAAAAGAALAYAVLAVLQDVLHSLLILAVERVGLTDLQDRIHRDLLLLDGLEHLERTDYLDRVTVVRGSAWGLMHSAWTAVGVAFAVAQLAVSLLLISSVSPWLTLLGGVAAVPLWCDRRAQTVIADTETATAESLRLQRQLFDTATAADSGKEIRVSGTGAWLVERQAAAWHDVVSGRFRARLVATAWRLAGGIAFTLAFVGGLAIAVHLTVTGRGTPGDIVLTITVATSLIGSVQLAVRRTTEAAGARRLIEPYLWLRDHAAGESASSGSRPVAERLTDGIRLDHVGYTYPGSERKALDDVTAHIPPGSVVAIVGEYGSGKTTVVKLLQKFYRPTEGAIRVDGTDLWHLDTQGWRARSTAVFQDFGRFRTVLAESIGIGDLPHVDDRARITEAVRAAAAQPVVEGLPRALDTQLGRLLGGVELSEGQWQKTALSRAVMRRDPLLIVLDEPTASLDAPSEQEIFERHMAHAREVARRTGGITVIVSHRFATVTGADLILVLSQGRLVESGSHEALMAGDTHYAEMYGLQAAAYTAPPPPGETVPDRGSRHAEGGGARTRP